MKKIQFVSLFFAAALFCACQTAKDSYEPDVVPGETGLIEDGDSGIGGGDNPGSGQTQAGQITAGEWRDLDNWLFWSNLMTCEEADQKGADYTYYSESWGFYTNNRVAVRVLNADQIPQSDVPVRIQSGNSVLYEARTDNRGETNLFIGLTQVQHSVNAEALTLVVNGQPQDNTVEVTAWGEEPKWNECTAEGSPFDAIDIAFIVDATGSMSDEIAFLKDDLQDIILKVAAKHTETDIRTAALFYRDEGDEYITRVSDFTSNLSTTTGFIDQQNADGGGDYPEAVHTALEHALQKLSWREDNCTRLAFFVLDAPPHKYDNVLTSLHQSVPQFAKHGIRIIPVAASGVDKPTEFFLRFIAIATDGTYVFITNDSGIGEEHINATVGDYEVELLNDLLVRLIDEYLQ